MTQVNEQAFVIPSGVRIEADADGFVLGNRGDVVVGGELSIQVKRLFSEQGDVRLKSPSSLSIGTIEASEGDVLLSGTISVDRIVAGGEVVLSGNLTIDTIIAKRIIFAEGSLTVKSLVAEETISLEGAELKAEMILGPQVNIVGEIRGRANVVEARNEIGPNLLKGGYRLEEYLEMFPGGDTLLDQYPDIKARYGSWSEEASGTAHGNDGASHEEPAARSEVSDGGNSTGEPVRKQVFTLTESVETTVPPRSESSVEWTSREADAAVQTAHTEHAGNHEALYTQLSECYIKIMGCYSDVTLPPPLNALENMIESRQFPQLKAQLTRIWNELLQFHKREGLHIANAVTHNVQEIKKLLQEAF